MVTCSTLRKLECVKPQCEWVVGKGCRSLQNKLKKSPIKAKTTKAKKRSSDETPTPSPVIMKAKPMKAKKRSSDETPSPAQAPNIVTSILKRVRSLVSPEKPKNIAVKGEVVLFTGFRDEKLENSLKTQGATVVSNRSKHVTMVIAQDVNSNSASVRFARTNNLKLVQRSQLTAGTKIVEQTTEKNPAMAVKKTASPISHKFSPRFPSKLLYSKGLNSYTVTQSNSKRKVNMYVLYKQLQHVFVSIMKKQGCTVADMGSFLGYLPTSNSYVVIAKVHCQTAPKGTYSVVACELVKNLVDNKVLEKNVIFLSKDKPATETHDVQQYVTKQYGKPLDIILSSKSIFRPVNKNGVPMRMK